MYKDILIALADRHRIVISRNNLLHISKDNRFNQWKDCTDLAHVIDFIQNNYKDRGRCMDMDGCFRSARKWCKTFWCVNRCIDCFAQKIIWLNAYKSSSNPKVIGGYFVEALKVLSKCPRLANTDRCTEICLVRKLQRHLCRNHGDALSVFTGVSTAN